MKDLRAYFAVMLLLLTVTLSGCEVIGDIFKAGMWTAFIGIFLIVALIWFLLRLIRGGR